VQQLDGITITVGDNSDVKLNTVCNNKMTVSGWYLCEGLTALQGNYFGIFSDSDFTNMFMLSLRKPFRSIPCWKNLGVVHQIILLGLICKVAAK
jgi:hypothetical protein